MKHCEARFFALARAKKVLEFSASRQRAFRARTTSVCTIAGSRGLHLRGMCRGRGEARAGIRDVMLRVPQSIRSKLLSLTVAVSLFRFQVHFAEFPAPWDPRESRSRGGHPIRHRACVRPTDCFFSSPSPRLVDCTPSTPSSASPRHVHRRDDSVSSNTRRCQ